MCPLDYQIITIPLGGGIDQKTDQRLLPQGNLTNVVNAEYTKLGSLAKRSGQSILSSSIFGTSSSIGTIDRFAVMDGVLFASVFGNPQMYTYDAAYGWVPQGQVSVWNSRASACTVQSTTIAGALTNFSSPDIALVNGMLFVSWIGGPNTQNLGAGTNQNITCGDPYLAAYDPASYQQLIAPINLTGYAPLINAPSSSVGNAGFGIAAGHTKYNCRLFTAPTGDLLVAWDDYAGGHIQISKWKVPGPGQMPYPQYLYTIPDGDQTIVYGAHTFDICADMTNAYVAFADNLTKIRVRSYDLGTFYPVALNYFPATPFTGSWSQLGNVACSVPASSHGSGTLAVAFDCNTPHIPGGGGTQLLDMGFVGVLVLSCSNLLSAVTSGTLGNAIPGLSGTFGSSVFGLGTYYNVGGDLAGSHGAFKGSHPADTKMDVGLSLDIQHPDENTFDLTFGGFVPVAVTRGITTYQDHSIPYTAYQPILRDTTKGASTIIASGSGDPGNAVDFGSICPAWNTAHLCYQVQATSKLVQGPFTNQKLFMAALTSSFQPTHWVMDVRADTTQSGTVFQPIATINPSSAEINSTLQLRNPGWLSHAVTSSQYTAVFQDSVVVNLDNPGLNGLQVATVDFSPHNCRFGVQLNDHLYFAGGVPFWSDGTALGEDTFQHYPDYLALTGSSPGVNNVLNAGTYYYQALYEWTDSRQCRMHSAPSILQSVQTTSPSGSNQVLITAPSLNVQALSDPLASFFPAPSLVIYRSLVNDASVMYRVTPAEAPQSLICYPGILQVSYLDNVTDIVLASNETIDTAGGVMANQNIPSAQFVCTHNNRLWLAGCNNPNYVYYSNAAVQGQSLTFNLSLNAVVMDGGAVTGICELGGDLVVFKEDRILTIAGDGPNSLNQGSSLSLPQQVITETGCINGDSIAQTPMGVFYQSHIGFMLLNPASVPQFIGGPVTDTLLQYPYITSALVHPTKNQVRWTLSSAPLGSLTPGQAYHGVTVVYDYLAQAWCILQLTEGSNTTTMVMDQASLLGRTYEATGTNLATLLSGSAYVETAPIIQGTSAASGSYTDNGSWVTMTVETPWIAVAGMQGHALTSHASLLCQMLDPCDVTVSIATDYNPTYTQTATYPASSISALLLPQLQTWVKDTRCQSIRIKFTDAPASDGSSKSGQGMSLTSVALRAGAMVGLSRTSPAAKR
jgi:hypothetical protein